MLSVRIRSDFKGKLFTVVGLGLVSAERITGCLALLSRSLHKLFLQTRCHSSDDDTRFSY